MELRVLAALLAAPLGQSARPAASTWVGEEAPIADCPPRTHVAFGSAADAVPAAPAAPAAVPACAAAEVRAGQSHAVAAEPLPCDWLLPMHDCPAVVVP